MIYGCKFELFSIGILPEADCANMSQEGLFVSDKVIPASIALSISFG
jgi:hypothetical protein